MSNKVQHRKTRRGWESRGTSKLSKAAAVVLSASAAMLPVAQASTSGEVSATSDSTVTAEPGQAANDTHPFHIPASALPDALNAFAAITGKKIHPTLAADKMMTFQSNGARGTMTEARALHELLEGTGLSAHLLENGVVEIGIRHAEEIDVTSSVASVNMQQFTEPLNDTPQTVQAVPQFIMQDEAVTSLRDALRNVPGISIAAGEGGQQGDTLTIRGFNARNDIFLDGIRDFGSYYRDSFDYDEVEVLQGPAGVEFGRGSTGGVVNQETKQADLSDHISGTMQLGTNAMRRLTADINEPIENLPGAALRMNIVGEETNIAGRDFTNTRRFGIAPALSFGLGSNTRYFLNYLHEGENDLPDYGLPYFGAGVAHVRQQNYYGFVENNYFRTNPDIVTGRAEHDFGQHLTVRNTLRWANLPRDINITEPQVNTTPIYTVNGNVTIKTNTVNGVTTTTGQLVSGTVSAVCSPTAAAPCYPVQTDPGTILVKRNQIVVKSVEDQLWDQASATGRFKLAGFDNDFLGIAEGGRERSRPVRPQTITYATGTSYFTPLTSPSTGDTAPQLPTNAAVTYVNTQSYGIGFLDTIKLREWLQISGGVRFDYFNTDYFIPVFLATGATTPTPATHLSRLDKQPTYRAAIVAKPRSNGSIYFDYGTSFNPSAESLSLSATNAVQAPQYNETYEVGSKWLFFNDRLNISGSIFQTQKGNVYETDPTNSLNVIPVGDQRVRGVQIGGLGHLPGHFDLIYGYAFLSGVINNSIQNYSPLGTVTAIVPTYSATKSIAVQIYIPGDPVYGSKVYYRSAVGNPFANVPKNTANFFLTHALWKGFVGGFGMNEVSTRRASSTAAVVLPNTASAIDPSLYPQAFRAIPGYWVFNAMLKRDLSHHVNFQVNVNNLTNKFFIDQPHPAHLIPGEGINAQFGFNYVWTGGHHGS